MADPLLARVPDGRMLRRLDNGLEIVRRRKHEPVGEEVALSQSDKRAGSKFLPAWTLERVVDWIEQQLRQPKCPVQPGAPASHQVRLGELVGFCRGIKVHTIRIVSDGAYVHAYPVEDQP